MNPTPGVSGTGLAAGPDSDRWRWLRRLNPFAIVPVLNAYRRGDFTYAQAVEISSKLEPPVPSLVVGFGTALQDFMRSHSSLRDGARQPPSFWPFMSFLLFTCNTGESVILGVLGIFYILLRIATQLFFIELISLLADNPTAAFWPGTGALSMGAATALFICCSMATGWLQYEFDM